MMRFSGNGRTYLAGLGAEAAAVEGKVNRVTAAMTRLNATTARFAGNFALAGAAVTGFSVVQAANLERQMKLFQMATGYSPRQMQNITSQVYKTGIATAQPAGTVGSEFVAITQMGLPPSLMTPDFLDKMTKFGDVVNLQSQNQIKAADAIKIAISSAHQLGLYSTSGIENLATSLMRTSFILPHGVQRFATQSKYFAPWLRSFGDSPESINQLMALSWMLDVSGMSTGRGGTSIAMMMRNMNSALQLTKHNEAGRSKLLGQMGLLRPDGTPIAVTLDKQGRPYLSSDIFADKLYGFVHRRTSGLHGEALIKARSNIVNMLGGAFGAQGGLFAGIMSNTGVQQLKMFHERFAKTPRSIDQAQAEVLDTFWGSLQKATSSVESFGSAMGSPGLKSLERFLNKFAGGFNNATMWAVKNPGDAGALSGGIAWATGVMGGIWASSKLFGAISGLSRFGNSIRGVTIATEAVNAAGLTTAAVGLTSVAGAIAAVSSSVGLFTGIYKNLSDASRDPRIGALLKWGASGSNYGQAPPGTSQDVDVFGRPIPHVTQHFHISLAPGTTKEHAKKIVDMAAAGMRGALRTAGRARSALPTSPQWPSVLNLVTSGPP
jgi:hypothetical protein